MPFPMEQQQEQDWCWNALTVSVQHYFAPSSELTQDQFAEDVFGAADDEPYYLQDALKDLNLLGGFENGPLSFAYVKQQLDQNLPVCVHIQWDGSDLSHYVAITGYAQSPGVNLVYVSDPILQDGNVMTWDFQAFSDWYSPSYAEGVEGTWVDTCLVHQPAGGSQ